MKRLSAPALMARLGWQWIVIAFAALALAAEDNGSGQKKEGGGNQQEQAKASKDPHNLQGDIRKNKYTDVNTALMHTVPAMCRSWVRRCFT